MSQITIRNLDPMVEELIREIAEEENKSLNQVCSDLIEKALNFDKNSGKKRDLSTLSGSWSEEDFLTFESSQDDFNRIDEELWQ